MKKIKKIIESPYFTAILFFIKMMIYYILIESNTIELILILISLTVWGIIFLLFSRSGLKRKRGVFLTVYILLSLLMFADTMYYNYYNQTVSVRQLWQARAVTAVPASFIATLIPTSFLLFLDVPFVYRYFKKYTDKIDKSNKKFGTGYKLVIGGFLIILITITINPFHSEAFTRVNSVEFFTNHVNDIYEVISDDISASKMDEEEILEVLSEVKPQEDNEEMGLSQPKYRGVGEGKKLIVIQMESIQDFVIGRTYGGEEITPNLNKLLEEDTIYFDKYYANTGKGNTADAEFSSMNSLYPLIDGEIYRLYEENTFNGLPWLLRDQGYNAFVVHGYKGDFWNRENAYPNQGFQNYISMEDLVEDEIIGMGISDKSVFKQLIPILKEEKGPYFAFVITLTNHHPFLLDEEYRSLTLTQEDEDTKFGSYLQTVRYTDEAIGQFIEDLKAEGLYEDTIIALYGDHHGLNCGMDDVRERLSLFLDKEYDYDEMLNVPLIIHIPGSGIKEKISTTGGQIDFMPTMANLMGLEPDDTFIMGQDLINSKDGFVAFTTYLFEGSFVSNDVIFQISREGVFTGSRAWNIVTGLETDYNMYRDEYERAILIKKMSKEILEQDLISKYVND